MIINSSIIFKNLSNAGPDTARFAGASRSPMRHKHHHHDLAHVISQLNILWGGPVEDRKILVLRTPTCGSLRHRK